MIAELTDETNVARGFSMLPLSWLLGFVIGSVALSCFVSNFLLTKLPYSPLIGGIFSRPQDHWPHIFSGPFWADYPYLLPCLIVAVITCISFVITALYLKEVCFFPALRRELCSDVAQTLDSPSRKVQPTTRDLSNVAQ